MSPDPSASNELGSEGYHLSGARILLIGFFLGLAMGFFVPTPFQLDAFGQGALLVGCCLLGMLAALPIATWLDPSENSLGCRQWILRKLRKAMATRPQFTLAYLFLETFWIAVALGLMTQAFRLNDDAASRFSLGLLLLSAQAWGAAIGGLFHRMKTGFFIVSAIIIGSIALTFLLVIAQ